MLIIYFVKAKRMPMLPEEQQVLESGRKKRRNKPSSFFLTFMIKKEQI